MVKKYDELRYQLMPYTYTLAWEARTLGMPLMRALWLHYPNDTNATKAAGEFLWGRDLLIAPVYQKAATSRKVYLPAGEWYDWWTNSKQSGLQTISRQVDLSIMPIYVKAGAIIPVDPVRQYTSEQVSEPTTLRVYSGDNGSYTLYDDDGLSMEYLEGNYILTQVNWNDREKKLTIQTKKSNSNRQMNKRVLNIELIPGGIIKKVTYAGKEMEVLF